MAEPAERKRGRLIFESSFGATVIEGAPGSCAIEMIEEFFGNGGGTLEYVMGSPPYKMLAEDVPASTPYVTTKRIRRAMRAKS